MKYSYPLPLVPAALKQFREATIFTMLDLCSTYNLVCIRKGDEWKTAFSTTRGHYEYLLMPYGLSCMLSVFQSLINDVFRDLLGKNDIAYLLGKYVIAYDDILIFSPDLERHVRHVSEVPKQGS